MKDSIQVRPRSAGFVISKALIVEDHPLFGDALAMTLQSISGVEEITTAQSLEEALAEIEAGLQPDIVMLDLNLPDVSGLEGLMQLRRAIGTTPILIVSSISDERTISAALRTGASGFVPKHSQRPVFAAALDCIAAGGVFVPEDFAFSGAKGVDEALRRMSSLTPQQARILSLICDGKLNKQIAWDMSIAEATVKAHVTAIMRKLAVQSRTQAVLIAQNARFDFLNADQ